MSDISEKYQKLALEYAKLKAQNQVLKRGIVDAKEKSMHLQDELHNRDKRIRQLEQEVDSCNFRNEQMLHRVKILQSEIECFQTSKQKVAPVKHSAIALDEDLENKIKENEMLHQQIFEAEIKNRQLEENLRNERGTLKEEKHLLSITLSNLEKTHAKITQQFKDEEQCLKDKLEMSTIKTNKNQEDNIQRLQEILTRNKTLKTLIEKYEKCLQSSAVFSDMNSLNHDMLKVLPFDKRSQKKHETLSKQFMALLLDLFDGFFNFHKYLKQRSKVYPVDSIQQQNTSATKMLTHHLNDSEGIFTPLLLALQDLPRNCLNLTVFQLSQISVFHSRFAKMFPYYVKSLSEECALCVCAPSLQEKNFNYFQQSLHLLPAVKKFECYIKLISGAKNDAIYGFAISKLSATCTELHLIFKELAIIFNSKISLECQLPLTSGLNVLHSSNELLLSSILSLSNSSAILSGFFSENTNILLPSKAASGVSSAIARIQSSEYLTSVILPTCPPYIPYKDALQNEYSFSSKSKDDLFNQLEVTAKKLNNLEQEKEYWQLETQLLQIKFDKTVSEDFSNDSRQRSISASLLPMDSSLLGESQHSICHENQLNFKSTEELIKQHMATRISESGKKIQASEAKSIHYETECHSLHKHRAILQLKNSSLQQELDKSVQTVSQLNDELAVIQRNYEEQLSLMSEHLAMMNDKLALQKDEINSLKFNN